MTTMTDFEREIGLLLTEIEAECEKLETRMRQAQEALDAVYKKRAVLQEALEIYRNHYRLPTSRATVDEALRQKLAGKTIKQMIVILALENQPPIFRVVDMNRKLVQAGMFKDEEAARDSVYSTLGRNSKTFMKVSPGQYMVNPERASVSQASFEARQEELKQGDSLREKIIAILREYPDWSRNQTLEELKRQGWDFGGKKPIFAVGACYASISKGRGKPKEEPEPVLLRSVS